MRLSPPAVSRCLTRSGLRSLRGPIGRSMTARNKRKWLMGKTATEKRKELANAGRGGGDVP